jgi:predicted HicB family RNase H-like nuclease
MQVEGYVQALREDLARVAAVGDEETARAAQLLAVALESSFGRRLLEVLNEAALEVSGQLSGTRVEVRLAGAEPELVVVEEAAEPAPPGDDVLSARITLRVSDALKQRVETAAARDGVSVNTWIVQALTRNANRGSGSGPGRRRLTGFGQS